MDVWPLLCSGGPLLPAMRDYRFNHNNQRILGEVAWPWPGVHFVGARKSHKHKSNTPQTQTTSHLTKPGNGISSCIIRPQDKGFDPNMHKHTKRQSTCQSQSVKDNRCDWGTWHHTGRWCPCLWVLGTKRDKSFRLHFPPHPWFTCLQNSMIFPSTPWFQCYQRSMSKQDSKFWSRLQGRRGLCFTPYIAELQLEVAVFTYIPHFAKSLLSSILY